MKRGLTSDVKSGRPMVADQFLALLLEYEDLELDAAVRDWVAGRWEDAMFGIPKGEIAKIQPPASSEPDDGRPMDTEAFLSLISNHVSSLDTIYAIRNWVEGDWDSALWDIPEDAIARASARFSPMPAPGL